MEELDIRQLDKWMGSNEAIGVTEIHAFANRFQPATAGSVWLWWREMTLAARWRG